MQFPPALREPQYRRYVIGNLFALNGVWAQRAVYAWLAWDLSGAASWVGAVAFLNFAPTLVAGPLFGVWADRTDLIRGAIKVQSAMLAVAAGLLAADLAGVLTLWALCFASFCSGMAMSAHHPIRMSLLSRIVPRGTLPNAIAISSVNFNLARLLGPGIGGGLIAFFGVTEALAVTVVAIAPFLMVLPTLTLRPRTGPAPARAGVAAALTEGARYAWANPLIRYAMLLTGVFAGVVRGALEVLPSIADGVFGQGAAGVGWIMAAAGGGALVAALNMAGRDSPAADKLPARAVWAIFAGCGLTLCLAVAPYWSLALAAAAGCGFCGATVGVSMQSVVQMNIDDGHRGRVMSLWIMVGIGSAALGALALGGLIDLLGSGPALAGAAALAALAAGALLAAAR